MNLVYRGFLGFAFGLTAIGCGRSDEVVIPENPAEAPPPGSLRHSADPQSDDEAASTANEVELPPQGQLR